MNIRGFIVSVLVFSGCIALPQVEMVNYRPDIIITSGDTRYMLVVAWRRSSLREKPMLELAESYAVSESGKKFKFNFKDNPYTLDDKNWVQGYLYLFEVADRNQAEPVKWTNGRWHLHLEFTKEAKREPMDIDIDISVFNYLPVIHGPPN